MNNCIEFSSVIPLSEMSGDSDADTELLSNMAEEAKAFIQAFDWCRGIRNSYFGAGVGGVVGVFFFRIFPATEEVDEYLWVIVGDIPPAYLVTDENRTPSEALQSYISEMRAWVAAVESGQSIDELIPVNVIPTRESAQALKSRLNFLETKSCRSAV
ncbi:MAG: hypothetical protein ABSH09_28570 [Bryobacteraceae bacterium]|jgi:hypothetical protein